MANAFQDSYVGAIMLYPVFAFWAMLTLSVMGKWRDVGGGQKLGYFLQLNIHSAHCTLHTAHCTLYTAYCTLQTAQYVQY